MDPSKLSPIQELPGGEAHRSVGDLRLPGGTHGPLGRGLGGLLWALYVGGDGTMGPRDQLGETMAPWEPII